MRRARVVMAMAFAVLAACNEERVEPTSSAISSTPAFRTRCAVENPGDAELDALDDAAPMGFAAPAVAAKAAEIVKIKVHVHVITTSDGAGDVSAQIPAQIAVLNTAYAVSRFRFTLASVEVVANDTWFFSQIDSPEELDMKSHLRRGSAKTLNIYTTNADGYLGWATFPKWYADDPLSDGVVLYYASLPGSGFAFEDPGEPDGVINYGEGDTGTHEVGHWLGLFHTFDGGCSAKGDHVKDTPAEAEPQFYCVVRDSCTGNAYPGFDPITNYMDYVDDDCMFQFTSDQDKRMHKQWTKFRE
jgi:hypothetical protein